VGDNRVDLVRDLSHSRFPPSSFLEPSSGYFVTVVVEGEMVVVVGDMARKAYRKMKAC
jgi:hypothetical protein